MERLLYVSAGFGLDCLCITSRLGQYLYTFLNLKNHSILKFKTKRYLVIILLWHLCGSLEEIQLIPRVFLRRSSPQYNIENKIDLFLKGTRCGGLCTYKERVDKGGNCSVILWSWSWLENCNRKSGQHWTDCCPQQPVPACPQFRTEWKDRVELS